MALFRALITTVQKLTPTYAKFMGWLPTRHRALQRASREVAFKTLGSAKFQ